MFPLKKTTFELKSSATETAYCSTMHVHFPHCVVRARLDSIPTREATSLSLQLFHELFQVVNMIVTKHLSFASEMLRVRSLVLMHDPN